MGDAADDDLHELLTRMVSALADERHALGARDFEALSRSLETKSEIAAALEDATAALTLSGRPLPAEVRDLARQCMDNNRGNGGAVELNQALVSGLLDTLCGERRGPQTYAADGRIARRDRARSVGQA